MSDYEAANACADLKMALWAHNRRAQLRFTRDQRIRPFDLGVTIPALLGGDSHDANAQYAYFLRLPSEVRQERYEAALTALILTGDLLSVRKVLFDGVLEGAKRG